MKLKPIGERVIVRRDDPETKSPGGLIIPDRAQDRPAMGEVVAINEDAEKCAVKVGDRILFSAYAGNDIVEDGYPLLILYHSDILAVLED